MAKNENLLTVKELQAIKPSRKGDTVKDGGGLTGTVSVNRAGAVSVSFTYQFRIGEKRREKRVGTWPQTDLAAIRTERDRLRGIVKLGIDPIEQERSEREEVERAAAAAELAKQEAAHAAALAAARMTFTDLFDKWRKRQLVAGRKDGGAEIKRSFEKDVLPKIGHLYADEIKRQQIAALLHDIVERGAGRMANLTLSNLRQCFGWAIGAGLLEYDPTSHLKKESFGGKETERDRVLSDDELRLLLQTVLPTSNLSFKAKAAVRVLLATMARVGELMMAKREHIDLARREWFLPETKNGRAHTIQLSDFAVAAMTDLLAYQDHPVWLFPDRDGTDHVCEKTLTKQIGDRQRDGKAPMRGRSKNASCLVLPGGRWTPHDLRRTGSTVMGELGVRDDVIERCLNHVEENKVKRTYQRQILLNERKEAFDVLGARLELLANADSDNVVILRTA